ncbi:mechanosensitive ion channel protein MscS [Methylobacterium haplocladii]|uniref:Mechanosensitive ion channel protein MscS n=3 Tax=Methylobacterium haplocladii TaxID=1176176 RepID=A0A512IJU8_9HYPH|nr:mechanosensitive ion channel protein MscS [Methylobacterium haplocladii]
MAALAAILAATALAMPTGAVGQGAAPPQQQEQKAAPAPQPGGDKSQPAQAAPSPGTAPQAAPAAPAPAAKPVAKPAVSEGIKTVRERLDEIKGNLDGREKAVTGRNVGAGDLTRARDGLEAVSDRIRAIIAALEPRLEAARERQTQLGPKPKDTEEGEDVAKERVEREHAVTEIDETQRLAKSLLVQSDQIVDQITNKRRAAFTRGLFERSSALFSPDLWMKIGADLPRDLNSLQAALEDIVALFARNGSLWNLLVLGIAFGISFALYFGRRNIAPKLGRRDIKVTNPSRRAKLLAAWRVLLLGTVPAVAGSYAVYYALDATDLLPTRLMPVASAILIGLAFIAFVQALSDALLAVGKPAWRPTPVSDAAAWRIQLLAVSIAVVITVSKSTEALNSGIYAALSISIATRGVGAVTAALLLAIGLHRFADTAEKEEACFGPYVATETSSSIGGPLRLLGWAATVLVGLGAIVGYVALSAFLVDQLIWTASLFVLLWLLIASADVFIGGSLSDDTKIATALQANTGLRKRSLNQIAVLATGFARVVLVAVAVLLALAPWGLDSNDVFSSLRSAFFGFKVGDVTISLSAIVFGVGILVLGVFLTRAIQRWLENTYLPATDLDAGLRNSISTVAGYVGFLLALALAFSYLGLSLEKLTIVAGALSVGIGFGLQSIVNNFVSGLLLLWERPIRVGDQVLIGDSEGIVKRISVRSTEIQTFDRSAVIVPNSNLISGVVKNRVRGDRTGRVIVSVSVLRNQDPVRAAEMLVTCASAHADVLKEPPPRVVFKKIGDPFLEFDLIALVTDVNLGQKVQSDLNFSVFKTLSDAGFIPPMGPASSVVTVQGLEPMRDALGQIANAVGTGAARNAATAQGSQADDDTGAEPARRKLGTAVS